MMESLDSVQLASLSAKLDEEESRVHAAVGSGASPMASISVPEPGDQTDIADRETQERQADAMLEHYRTQLADIVAARVRIMQGTYGTCTDCGAPIVFGRLSAYPTAKRCTDCQRAHERLFAASS